MQAVYDNGWYEKGVKVTATELAELDIHHHDWHGEWNYTITA